MNLKKCPFCGGDAELRKNEDWPTSGYSPNIYWLIGCNTDGCFAEISSDNGFDSEVEAVLVWETRAKNV